MTKWNSEELTETGQWLLACLFAQFPEEAYAPCSDGSYEIEMRVNGVELEDLNPTLNAMAEAIDQRNHETVMEKLGRYGPGDDLFLQEKENCVMPSVQYVITEFATLPVRWAVDFQLYDDTWKWALEHGEYMPEPYFTNDELPRLAWMAVMQDDENGRVLWLPSGVILLS